MLIFVTATDTDAGKTWVTAAAIRSLLADGIKARALKPIACGLDENGHNEDLSALLAAQGLDDVDAISLLRYTLPAAPSQAAASEGLQVDADSLLAWCEAKVAELDVCLIEGVGGLMVPITDRWLVSDWLEAMGEADIWLVVACRLGAINQALLSLDKLKAMGRKPGRIIFNAPKAECEAWLESTMQAVIPFLDRACEIYVCRFGEEPSPLHS